MSNDPLSWLINAIDRLATLATENHVTILTHTMAVLVTLTVPLSLLMFIGIVFAIERLKLIRRKENEIYNAKVVPGYAATPASATAGDPKLNEKWTKVLTHVESGNSNDWMLAIIEADIILADILEKLGYQGDSIGEKLKRVEKSDFTTLDQAWEAHKVRNAIAHQGSDFVLNQREAKRVIGLYRQVFEEFYYI